MQGFTSQPSVGSGGTSHHQRLVQAINDPQDVGDVLPLQGSEREGLERLMKQRRRMFKVLARYLTPLHGFSQEVGNKVSPPLLSLSVNHCQLGCGECLKEKYAFGCEFLQRGEICLQGTA